MKKLLASSFLILISFVSFSQNVGIGATSFTPNAASMLEVQSTDAGFLMPRMTAAERAAMNPLPAAAKGLAVYQTDGAQGVYYNTSSTTTPAWSHLVGAKVKTITSGDSPYTAGDETTILANAASGAITVNLPAASGVADQVYTIKKTDASNDVTIDGNGSETIDGATTATLSNQYEFYTIISDGSNWHITGTNVSAGGGGGGGFTSTQVFTSNGTFTVPAGVTNIMVEVWGGGGGGGYGNQSTAYACGGQGGGYGRSFLTVTPGANHAVTIGAGGAAATGTCGLGSTGGTTSFGTPTSITATGGQGGNGCGTNKNKSGGTSTGQVSMTGQRGNDSNSSRQYGGLSGNGSRYGEGGLGHNWQGDAGASGAVIVTW